MAEFPQAKNTLVELASELQFYQAELDQRYPTIVIINFYFNF